MLILAQHTKVCSVRPGLHGSWKPTSGLTFIGKVILGLLSTRVFLLLNVVETGFVSLGEEKWENGDSFTEVTCVYMLITTGINMAQNPLLSVSTT